MDESDVLVVADSQRLLQVMLNLLSNAVKYNHKGGKVLVAVEARMDLVEISVIDWGLGIDPERANGLFEPFDRLGAQQSGIEGTGLGLTLSKGLVRQMHGDLTYRPNENEGSIFTVSLLRGQNPAIAFEETRKHMPLQVGEALPDATILLIEDNQSNVGLVSRILEGRRNIKVVPAMQGRLGLDLALEIKPDLILLDLNLPDIGGEEVLEALRRAPATKDLPVLVTSADATPRIIDRLMGRGATGYLTKPLDIPKFLTVIDNILGEVKISA